MTPKLPLRRPDVPLHSLARRRYGGIFSGLGGTTISRRRYSTVIGELVIPNSEQAGDRRANLVLRALIDEMLERVRALNASPSTMTTDERSRAEAELESIMARVRRYSALREQPL
jgi:hypothetical protein